MRWKAKMSHRCARICGRLNFSIWNKSNKYNSFTNANLYWWLCGTILCDYKRVILWFDLIERFVGWICSNVILIRTPNILQFGWRMDRRSLERNYNESLAMSLLEILYSSRSLCSSCVLRVLGAFFVFEGLWRKLFGALEAWIRRASPICDLLMFLEAFEFDSNDLWDLGRWFGWFLFECSSYSKLKFLEFLEDSRLGSNRASRLLNLDLLQLFSLSPLKIFLKCLRKASIYRSLGVGKRYMVESNWWHMSQPYWFAYVITYTRWIACVITYTCADARLVFAWHLANFCWLLSSDSKI